MDIIFKSNDYTVFFDKENKICRILQKRPELFPIELQEDILEAPGVFVLGIQVKGCGTKSLDELNEMLKIFEIADRSAKEIKAVLINKYNLNIV